MQKEALDDDDGLRWGLLRLRSGENIVAGVDRGGAVTAVAVGAQRGKHVAVQRSVVVAVEPEPEVTADNVADIIVLTLSRPRHLAVNEILLKPASQT